MVVIVYLNLITKRLVLGWSLADRPLCFSLPIPFVCLSVTLVDCGHTARSIETILVSLEIPNNLVAEQVGRFSVSHDLYLTISAEMTSLTKIAFFSLCSVDFWENRQRYGYNFYWQLLEKWAWAFERHKNEFSNLTFTPFGGKERENVQIWVSRFQMT